MIEQRNFCQICSNKITLIESEGREREYCAQCDRIFYRNPLPVVSAIIVNDRHEILLVLRDREPEENRWCLPSGFVELNESISKAALRELKEETGVEGQVIQLLDTMSYHNPFYGDLIWITFEIQHVGGSMQAGDDAREVRFFPIESTPELAFPPNRRAVDKYLNYHRDLRKMDASFHHLESTGNAPEEGLLSDAVFTVISQNAADISDKLVKEIMIHNTTRNYRMLSFESVFEKVHYVISHFGQWIIHPENDQQEMREYYQRIGRERTAAGFKLSEVISAVSLTRKHIFAFVFGQSEIWNRSIQIYTTMEFMTRVNLFFDRAVYHIAHGFEKSADS